MCACLLFRLLACVIVCVLVCLVCSVRAARIVCSTTGALGYYSRMLAQQGLISIIVAQSPEMVSPHGSYAPFFGTNPISVGVPAGKGREPIVFDMATSAIAYYGMYTAEPALLAQQPPWCGLRVVHALCCSHPLTHASSLAPLSLLLVTLCLFLVILCPHIGVVEAAMSNQSLPRNAAFTRHGRPTRNPNEALAGALRPFGASHKGSGLALIVELLTGAWVGGALTDKVKAKNWGTSARVACDCDLCP
mgnify:CR=1 FL=1